MGMQKRQFNFEVDSITADVEVVDGVIHAAIQVTPFRAFADNEPTYRLECALDLRATAEIYLIDGEMSESRLLLSEETRLWCTQNGIAVSSMMRSLNEWLLYEVGFQVEDALSEISDLDGATLEHSPGDMSLNSVSFCVEAK